MIFIVTVHKYMCYTRAWGQGSGTDGGWALYLILDRGVLLGFAFKQALEWWKPTAVVSSTAQTPR